VPIGCTPPSRPRTISSSPATVPPTDVPVPTRSCTLVSSPSAIGKMLTFALRSLFGICDSAIGTVQPSAETSRPSSTTTAFASAPHVVKRRLSSPVR
jgi:hypothetical protein